MKKRKKAKLTKAKAWMELEKLLKIHRAAAFLVHDNLRFREFNRALWYLTVLTPPEER